MPEPAGVSFRRLTAADLDEVRAVAELSPSTRRLLPAVHRHPDQRWLVARDGRGGLVGVAGVLDAAGDAHVLDVWVRADQRRRGVGGRLLRRLLATARDELGSAAATLEVRASNRAAQALYRRVGFEDAGLRPGYYPPAADGAAPAGAGAGGREDAVIMWLHDLDGIG